MSIYVKVLKESPLYKEFDAYWNMVKSINDVVKCFLPENGIESTLYIAERLNIGIQPTVNDLIKFEKQFSKRQDYGIRYFKRSSKIF